MAEYPSDYDAEDCWSDGIEICPHCEKQLTYSMESVVDADGTMYDTVLDTDAGNKPVFCVTCWKNLSSNLRAANNRSITEWS